MPALRVIVAFWDRVFRERREIDRTHCSNVGKRKAVRAEMLGFPKALFQDLVKRHQAALATVDERCDSWDPRHAR